MNMRVSVAAVLIATCLAGAPCQFADAANNVTGAWLSPNHDNWPLVPVHTVLTPDGRVLTYGSDADGEATGLFSYDVWDPADGLDGGHVTLHNMTLTDIFCSYTVIDPNTGNILIVGGDVWDGTKVTLTGNNNTVIYRTSDRLLSRGDNMKLPRWYATVTPLMNGEMYIQGGKGGTAFAEMRDRNGRYRTLTGVPTANYVFWYPRNFLAPDGRIFGFDVDGKMYYVTTTGSGSITPAGELGSTNSARVSTSAMFRPGKILQVSGKNTNALVIDINGQTPVVKTTSKLSAKRAWASSTVLPNGKVLVTGGSGVANELTNVTNKAEIWDPDTGKWTLGTAGSLPRLYHSFALLLPDASVLVGGGGASDDAPIINFRSEIYYPPYLYNASGGFAARPTINSAPSTLVPGGNFSIGVGSSGISRVTLLQTGAPTHGMNVQQRFVELSFTRSGNTLNVHMHDKTTDVPPGYYLLFVLNDAGVPSVGKIVRINIAGGGGGGDSTAPSKPSGFTVALAGGKPTLTWNASTDSVGVAGYSIYRSANGTLGAEIALVTTTGWTDAAAAEGTTYTYAVRAYDAAGNLSDASALQSIAASEPPTVPKTFGVALSGKKPQLTFKASTDNEGVAGYNVYRSSNGTLGALYAQIAGSPWVDSAAKKNTTYTYAVRARDAAGNLSTATALKSIKSN